MEGVVEGLEEGVAKGVEVVVEVAAAIDERRSDSPTCRSSAAVPSERRTRICRERGVRGRCHNFSGQLQQLQKYLPSALTTEPSLDQPTTDISLVEIHAWS